MLIEGNKLSFKYPHTGAYVFRNLIFQIPGPGFHSLFGPSGAGKTTLAKIVSGEINTHEGHVGTSAGKGRVFYSYNLERLPPWCSVGEHLNEVAPRSNQDKLHDLTYQFGLEPCLDSRFGQLSLGQQNRANLARYLLQDFDLLIMDESLANVDERTKEHIILKMKEMFPSRSFLYISHNVLEVSKFCAHILVLRSPPKTPQAISVKGQDHRTGKPVAEGELERTMLEVVHAV
ncbi:MAG: ATP-binding cassette domain-containing protein [Thermodesulfobacteriota bacterium]|nr:ATP-binding cassette domain-containing protein [Thermodesulfobacteriota bacterium]